jgi:hypothetical protein
VPGIVTDKIAYRIFKGKEDYLRKRIFEEFGNEGYYWTDARDARENA